MRALRWIIAISALIGVLAGLFVIADRWALSYARDAVATQIEAELDDYTSEPDPDVEIAGFPFLTQVASGEYDRVVVRLDEATSQGLTFHDTELTATSVTAPISDLLDGQIHAQRLAGSAVVGFEGIAAATGIDGLELESDGDGLVARAPAGSLFDALGVQATGVMADALAGVVADGVMLIGTGSVRLDGDRLILGLEELRPEDEESIPAPVAGLLDNLASGTELSVAVPPLPYGLKVRDVSPTPDGVAVTLSATDVTLA